MRGGAVPCFSLSRRRLNVKHRGGLAIAFWWSALLQLHLHGATQPVHLSWRHPESETSKVFHDALSIVKAEELGMRSSICRASETGWRQDLAVILSKFGRR